ncbi:hypothetical protein FRAAL3316 [Frankia alni ACN14a]|uniref:Uncharacterized protein n=1 Tax=Frankia alni (strain DSM 45986 / CECT 9034 / ACN14a) TaxID=326424 RepID=Q0RKJ8_FRAAA|nr:hypothetical protein FRAAL3316 [Frankia alni ACN14a]
MSEYRYHEFLAVDRPLDAQAQPDVRSPATRAQIIPPLTTYAVRRGPLWIC